MAPAWWAWAFLAHTVCCCECFVLWVDQSLSDCVMWCCFCSKIPIYLLITEWQQSCISSLLLAVLLSERSNLGNLAFQHKFWCLFFLLPLLPRRHHYCQGLYTTRLVLDDDGSQKEVTPSRCIEMYFNVWDFNPDMRPEVSFFLGILKIFSKNIGVGLFAQLSSQFPTLFIWSRERSMAEKCAKGHAWCHFSFAHVIQLIYFNFLCVLPSTFSPLFVLKLK